MTLWKPVFARNLLTLILAAALAACTFVHPQQPNYPPNPNLSAGETVTVQPNQSVYGVAVANHVSMRDLIIINNLKAPFSVHAGQKLVLPMGGGSPMPITGNGVSPSGPNTLISASPLGATPAATMASGASSSAVETQELAPVSLAPAAPTAAPKPVAAPQVEGLNKPSVAPQNVATTMNTLGTMSSSGQATQVGSAAVPGAPVSTPTAVPAPAAVTLATDAAGVNTAASTAIGDSSETDSNPNAGKPNFIWPVQGPIISTFGSKGQGMTNDGINISAPKGSPVVAAAPGTVAYAGNDMKGFGNLILLRHADGWVTAYAHLERILVNKDAVVASGDMIGTVGKTGSVQTTQLHFETRHNSKAIDPSSLIAKP